MRRNFIYNAPGLKPRRRQLRNKSTLAEKLLWSKLRKRQLKCKFVRQYSVSGFVIDFFAPEARLAIEIDGKHHADKEQMIYDRYRTRYISAADIKEVRFSNEEVISNTDMIVNKIKLHLPS